MKDVKSVSLKRSVDFRVISYQDKELNAIQHIEKIIRKLYLLKWKNKMAVSQIVADKRGLKKLLKDATRLKVYEGEPRDFMGKMYISITNEYKDKNPHIVFTQGGWSAKEGGEYEIRIYVPMFKIDNRKIINRRYLNKVYIAIYNAIKDRFGDNFHFCNHHLDTWNPMAKFKFYIQIPNFK